MAVIEHVCEPPQDAPEGVLWRCECSQLWQLSPTRGYWVQVDAQAEQVFRMLGFIGDDE